MRELLYAALLADHLPLKQGLRRLAVFSEECNSKILADHLPLKQGLRPWGYFL